MIYEKIKLCAICGNKPKIKTYNYYGSKRTYNLYSCCINYAEINLKNWNELQTVIIKKIKKSEQEGLEKGKLEAFEFLCDLYWKAKDFHTCKILYETMGKFMFGIKVEYKFTEKEFDEMMNEKPSSKMIKRIKDDITKLKGETKNGTL